MTAALWLTVAMVVFAPCTLHAGPLRVSVPPWFGAVPVVLASHEGWDTFAKEDLDVHLVPLPSQRDRTLAFEAGQLDVLVTDLAQALILVTQEDADAIIAGCTYTPPSTRPNGSAAVALIAHHEADVGSLDDLVDQANAGALKIAVPRPSDLEFMLDSLFEQAGYTAPQHAYVGSDDLIHNILYVGLELFGAGVFPQPYAELLVAYGEFVLPAQPLFLTLSDFSGISVPPTVIVFRRGLLDRKPHIMAAFFRALDRAVDDLNALAVEEVLELGWELATLLFLPGQDPDALSPTAREHADAALRELFVPPFPAAHPLEPEPFHRVLNWAKDRGYLTRTVPFDKAVTAPTR